MADLLHGLLTDVMGLRLLGEDGQSNRPYENDDGDWYFQRDTKIDANLVKRAWDARPDLHDAVIDRLYETARGSGVEMGIVARAMMKPEAVADNLVQAARAAKESRHA